MAQLKARFDAQAIAGARPALSGAKSSGFGDNYLRKGMEEDALVARAVGSAAELCEQFTGEVLLARSFSETLAASAAWTRLGRAPVRAILGVERIVDGVAAALPAGAYSVDIDAGGRGWVRVSDPGAARLIRIAYSAGLAAEWSGAPEALRQGIIRLAAHLYTHRADAEASGPPAAVTALWRPFRRMRLA
jgi:uncharacterized phiE125 gp8 family phage protein